MLLWTGFIIIAAVIAVCGTKLSKYGDVIAEKSGLGRAWIGLILMASITSLPELMTGVSSVSLAGLPDIAAGDIMGSCVFNLVILALLDPMHKGKPIFSGVGQSHLLSAGFGVTLMGLISVSILLEEFLPSFLHIGVYTPIIFVIYVTGIRLIYSYEKKFIKELASEGMPQYEGVSMKKAVSMYSLNALIVVVVATALPFIAGRIAETTGLGGSFVGTVFVAITTSLPELVVSFAALRIGAPDLATGNILGSNMFNILILGIDDIAYINGPLLSDISSAHSVTGLMAILMTAIVLISITYRPHKKTILSGRFGWDSLAMLAIGVLNMYFVYKMG